MRDLFDRFISWLYINRFYGPRCPDFATHCPCCQAWKNHDELFASPRDADGFYEGMSDEQKDKMREGWGGLG